MPSDITLQRDDLAKALGRVGRIVERRTTIPILSNIRLTPLPGEQRLRLTATDLDIEATATLAATISPDAGEITVNASLLDGIVRKLADGVEVTLSWDDDSKVALRAGRARFSLQALPASDYPDIAAGDMPVRFTLPVKTLAGIIADVGFAISSEETRYYLNGIFFHAREGDGGPYLCAVATDGHRLSMREIIAPEGAERLTGIIVPRKTIGEIARIAKDFEGDAVIEVSNTKTRLTLGDTILVSKLIDGTYPDYQRVIPKGNSRIAKLPRETLRAAVDRVATVSSERGRAVKLTFDDGRLALSVKNPDAGSAEDELTIDYADTPVEIGFNATYLGEVLGTLSAETCRISLDQSGSPTLFHNADDTGQGAAIVLMPMRV